MANAYNTTVSNIVGNDTGLTPDGSVAAFPVSIAAAGTTQATAAALTGASATVTGATGSNGVILQLPTSGQTYYVYNASASALLLYPPAGGSINGGTVNASQSMTAKKPFSCRALDGLGNWAVGQFA